MIVSLLSITSLSHILLHYNIRTGRQSPGIVVGPKLYTPTYDRDNSALYLTRYRIRV